MEDLQQMEARALSAELALDRLKTYATDTFILWEKDQDSKVGKRLLWMSGAGNEGYEPNLNWIHKPDLTAARELMRKAESVDFIRMQWDKDTKRLTEERDMLFRSREKWMSTANGLRNEADTLRNRLRESEAMVERLKDALDPFRRVYRISKPLVDAGRLNDGSLPHEFVPGGWPTLGDFRRAEEACALTPATALAEYRDEVLTNAADKLMAVDEHDVIATLRKMAMKGGTR